MDLSLSIREVMCQDLVVVASNNCLEEFESLFERRGIHHLLVLNSSEQLVGIISNEDVLRCKNKANKDKILAEHLMSDDVLTVQEDIPLKEAIEIFLSQNFRAIPVKSKNQLVGIITPYDILKYSLTIPQ